MTPGETTETGFVIDGATYPIPGLDTFTMDEAVTLYEYSGLTLEDFAPSEEEDENEQRSKRMRHPGLMQSLLHIAYQRGNPTVKKPKVKALVGGLNLLEAFDNFADDAGEDDAGPPAVESTSEPDGSLPRSSDDSNGSSGNGLKTISDAPEDGPPTTGVTRSVTSLTSVPETSAA